MAQRISEDDKNKIKEAFINGQNIDDLALKFNCHKLTISRNLKKSLGEDKCLTIGNSYILRTSWVYSPFNKYFLLTILNLQNKFVEDNYE